MFEPRRDRVTLLRTWVRTNILTIVLIIFILLSTLLSAYSFAAIFQTRRIVREQMEAAKRRLSEADRVELAMDVAEIHFKQPLERWDFERLIGPDVRAVEACLQRAVKSAGLEPEQIDLVVRTGGSSRIPRYVQMLRDMFPRAELLEQDVYTSVASGLAIAATQGGIVDGD